MCSPAYCLEKEHKAEKNDTREKTQALKELFSPADIHTHIHS